MWCFGLDVAPPCAYRGSGRQLDRDAQRRPATAHSAVDAAAPRSPRSDQDDRTAVATANEGWRNTADGTSQRHHGRSRRQGTGHHRPASHHPEGPPRRPLRRHVRRHRAGWQDPVKGLTFERRWTTPGRPPLRRDHLGEPHRRHRQRDRQDRLRAEGRRGPRRSGASSPPTSSSASTSAATSARRSARPASSSSSTASSTRSRPGRRPSTTSRRTRTSQAFKAELTHLLVHQKMAFNSPVWFNVGIEPQAAVLGLLHQLASRTRWARSWTSPRPRPCSSSSARAPAATCRTIRSSKRADVRRRHRVAARSAS